MLGYPFLGAYKLFKLLLLYAVCTLSLTACEKEKQDSTSIGSVPKQIIDKTSSDIDKATEIAAERLKAAENLANPESVEK
jgi:hypothetical protein